jgi:preprotein translocase subunit SecA
MSFFTKLLTTLLGDPHARRLREFAPLVDTINALEASLLPLSDDELSAKTTLFRQKLAAGSSVDDLLPESFAVVREASKRVLGLRHFDVQLIGGIVLHRGGISEMKTGEGKTLMSTLASYLNALEGKGVYLVTVNDYLARRDSEWMGQIFRFLGLSVGLIQSGMSPVARITLILLMGQIMSSGLIICETIWFLMRHKCVRPVGILPLSMKWILF